MKLSDFLGKHSSVLLASEPFVHWRVKRSVEDELEEPIVQYTFDSHAFSMRCDSGEMVIGMFLRADKRRHPDDERLFEVPFAWSRGQVERLYGPPSKVGAPQVHPILGKIGAWERFSLPDHTVHFEYEADRDVIKRITLMHPAHVP